MKCRKNDPDISRYLQTFIHAMNEPINRDAVIYDYIQSANDVEWLGTWYVKNIHDGKKNKPELVVARKSDFCPTVGEKLADRVRFHQSHLLDKTHVYKIFTVCIYYDINLVHYVSFVFDVNNRNLISFDPGIELYKRGLKTIIPALRRIFYSLRLSKTPLIRQQDALVVGRCDIKFNGKKYGIQFNGQIHRDLPADAFCQTWTIFFLVRLVNLRNTDFVSEWCSIHPYQRESYILSSFIIPILERNKIVSEHYFQTILDEKKKVLSKLVNYSTRCLFNKTA